MANKINFEVGFTTNSKGLKELKSELAELRALANDSNNFGGDASKIQAMVKSANDLEHAMTAAFDVDLNTVNIQKFNKILKECGTDLSQIQQNFAYAGTAGQAAFLKATAGLMQFNTVAKQTNHFLDSIATSFANTIKWSAMSSIINTISSTIQKSYYYVKDLDSALNDIRIVTGKNADEMSRFAESANEAAKALAVTTEDYTKGSLIYYQQGLDDETVKTLTDITAKTSNVTGQSMSAVSEELTAVWNGYQVANEAAQEGMQVYEEYVDKMAAVGASTASDLQELSTAMSKVASAASAMGVGFDDLNAQIATIVSVTRQAPESVGTALKTIYARLGDLKVDGVDEFGTKLGEVSEQLKVMGINVLESNGDMRDMSDVMTEVAQKWDTWTEAQRQAAAVAMAGKRQYNNLIALFDNWDMYGEALQTSMEATGTLEKQQAIALDSLSNKMDQLKATAEDLYDSLYDEEDIKGLVEDLTKIIQCLADFSDSIGGLTTLLPMLGATALRVFDNQISNAISTVVTNSINFTKQQEMMKQNAEELRMLYSDSSLFASDQVEGTNNPILQNSVQELTTYYSEMKEYQNIMTEGQKETYKYILDNIAKIGEMKLEIEESTNSLIEQNAAWKNLIELEDKSEQGLEKRKEDIQALNTVIDKLSEQQALGVFDTDKPEELQQIFNEIGETLDDVGKNKLNSIIDKFNELNTSGVKVPNLMEKIISDLKRLGATDAEVQKLNQALDSTVTHTENVKNSLNSALDLQQVTKTITNTVGALGQLATSINTFKNLGGIWLDKDADIGEKILKTVMNLSFALPALISATRRLNESLGITTALKARDNALSAASIPIIKGATAADYENAVISRILLGTQTEEVKAIIAESGARLDNIGTLSAETKAKLINAGATTLEKNALEKAVVAQNAWNASLLLNPVIAIIAAVVALTGALVLYNETQKKVIEEENKLAQQRIDTENKKQEEIDNNQKVYESYIHVYNAYKEGKATKDELKTATDELNAAYGEEIDNLALLAGNYEALTESIKNKRKAELEEGKESAQREYNSAAAQVRNAALTNMNEIGQVSFDSGIDSNDEAYVVQAIKRMNPNAIHTFMGKDTMTFNLDWKEPDKVVAAYDEISAIVEQIETELDPSEYAHSEIYTQAREWVDAMTDSVNALKAAEEDLVKYKAELATIDIDYSNVKNIEDYNAALEQTKKAISSATGIQDEERLLALAQKYMEVQNNTLTIYRQQKAAIEELKENENFKSFLDDQLNHLFDKYTAQELNGLVELGVEITPVNIDEKVQEVREKFAEQEIPIALTAAGGILEDLQNGKINNLNALDNEGFIKLRDSLDQIKKTYPELTNEAIVLGKEWLVGTQRYTEALEEVQDKLYELDLQQSFDKLNEKIDEFFDENGEFAVNIDADPSAFEDKMEEILNAEYEVDVKIHTEAEQEFNSVTSAIDNLHTKASLIGDDFKVSADKIRELNQTFPGIIEGMTILKDGTVQLNKEVVQSAMETAEAEAKADAEATVAKLENQAKMLRAKQATYERLANIAFTLAKTESDTDKQSSELRTQFSNELRNLKELNSKDAADKEMDDQKAVADSSNENGLRTAQNWESAFKSMAESSLKAAKAAIQNMNAVANKDAGATTTGDFGKLNYQGSSGVEKDAAEVTDVDRILEETGEETAAKAWAKIGEQYSMLADEAGASANDIEGMIAQIGAGGSKIDKALSGVASGLGSDSKKDKSKSKKEHKDDEVNRYWEIEKALEKIADALKKVDKLKSHTFGKQKIQVLKQESELIKQQTQLYEQLYEEQKKEAEELRGKLSAGGMTFSAEGEITNYGEALKGALASYNKAVDDFNAGLINDEGFKTAEQNYEKFKKNVERYDKLFYSEMKDTREKIEEEAQKLRDIQLESFEIKVQVKIDKAQLRKDFRNFRKELKKDFTLEYEVLPKTKSFKKDFKDDKSQVNTYKKAAQEIEKEIDIIMAGGQSKMFATLSEAQEKLKEVNEKFQEASRNTMQDVEDAWNNYIALIDQTNEKLDDQIERYDQIQNELDDWKQMIELVYGDKAYDKMDDYYAQAKQNSLAQIDSLKRISDAWEIQFQKALAAEGATMDRTDLWSEDLTKLYQNWINSEDKLRDATNEHIKLLKDDYANTVEGIIDQLDKDLTGGKGLEQMKKEWEETKEFADKYYNSVQKAYHIQTLNNKIQKSINKQSNIKNAQKLEKLRQKELGELREMERMSEYDLKVAEAKYDIALKEIALEESRNNKNTMKLSRNAEGNWSYQYVADEGDVEDRQQDLLDAYMHLQDISDEQMSKLMDEGLAAIDNLKEEIRTVYKKAEAEKWSQEKLEQELAILKDKYYGKGGVITNISEEFEKARREAAESGLAVQAKCYELDKTNFENLTIEVKRLFDEANEHLAKGYSEEEDGFEKTFEDANKTMSEQWYDFLHNEETGIQPSWEKAAVAMGEAWVGTDDDSVVTKVGEAFAQINTKFGEYLSDLDTLQETSGIKFGEISNYIASTATATSDVNKNVKELVKQTKNIEKQRKEIEKLMSAWDKVKESIDKASKSIEDYLKKQQDIKEPTTPNTPAASSYSGSSTSNYGSGSSSGSGTNTYAPQTPQVAQTPKVTVRNGLPLYLYRTSSGNYRKLAQGVLGSLYDTKEERPLTAWATAYPTHRFFAASPGSKPTDAVRIPGYKTGGYTGSWSGSEGRLAELHQKELVLNAKDTENFLAATDSLRKLTSLDASIEKSIANAISKMLINMAAANNGTNNITTSNNEVNTNNVFNINAEFPNANDVDEIREAILSLPNLASQYIHRSGF